MSLAAPLGLIALLALPIIVVLHLLGARRRRQVVPSLLLWRDVPARPQGVRWQALPLTPLLLLHLLLAALLGLALARPQMAGLPAEGARHTAVVIDTSTSMDAREGARTRLDLARDRARALITALRPGDQISLVSAGPRATIIAEGGASDMPLLNAALGRVQTGGVGTDIDRALTLAEAALQPERRRQIVVLTDGALPPIEPRQLTVPVEWVTLGSNQPNRAIVTFATRPWGGKLQLYARIANYSSVSFPTTLSLYGDDELIGRDVVPLAPGGEYELTWSLPASVGDLRAELDGADVLPDDDRAYLSIRPARSVRALLVTAQPDPLQRALAAIPGVEVTLIDPSAYTPAQSMQADLTILDSFLPEAWPPSPTLAINPPGGGALLAVAEEPREIANDTLVQRGELLDGLSFSGVRLGAVRGIILPDWATALLVARSESLDDQGTVAVSELPLVIRGRVAEQEVAVWTFDLARGNLPARLAFPLLVSRMVHDLTASTPPPAIAAGASLALRPDSRADVVALIAPDGADDLVAPGAALEDLARPGFYRVEERAGPRVLYSARVGVNTGAPGESRIAPQAPPDISGPLTDPGGPALLNQPVDLWPWLVGAALALLAFEWLYVLRR